MTNWRNYNLNPGVISVLQTPFTAEGQVDFQSLIALVEDAIQSGVDGFLVPAVASEVAYLSLEERKEIVRVVAREVNQRVPIIVGASSDKIELCREFASLAAEIEATAYLVAVPEELYGQPDQLLSCFQAITASQDAPLIIQDLQWNGPGLDLETINQLKEALPQLIGLKIETVPAGPKYTAVRNRFGDEFFISGGWAVPQWIEALDRGIDAMIPESSMISVYAAILKKYREGKRDEAINLFRQLLPVLTYTNQEIAVSISFFIRLLVRRGIFQHETMRFPGFTWDVHNSRIADELIQLYLELEQKLVWK